MSATMTPHASVPAKTAKARAPPSRACPSSTTRSRPQRSASTPNTGESAYMPPTCSAMVIPTSAETSAGVAAAPWAPCAMWDRCTGVIAMTDAITTCDPAIAKIA